MYNVGDEVFYHSVGSNRVKLCKVVKVKEKTCIARRGTAEYRKSYEYLVKFRFGRMIVAQDFNLI